MPRGMRGQGRKGGARSRPGGVTNNQLAMSQRAPKMQVFRFRRVVQEVLSGSVTGIVGYTPLVTLGKFPSNSEFLALFTQYRLAKLTILFAPAQDGANFAFPYPKVNTVFDYTTLAALGSVTEAQQFQSWKQTVFNISRTQAKITYTPRLTQTGVNSQFGSSSEVLPVDTWVDVANASAVYFGLRAIWENLSTTQSVTVTLIGDWEFKGVK